MIFRPTLKAKLHERPFMTEKELEDWENYISVLARKYPKLSIVWRRRVARTIHALIPFVKSIALDSCQEPFSKGGCLPCKAKSFLKKFRGTRENRSKNK